METTLLEIFKQVGTNIIMLGGVVGAIAVIISQTKAYKAYQKRKRIASCPVSELLKKEIEHTKQLGVQALGGQIIMICDRAIYKGYLEELQRNWLIENFELYTKTGGNGVVKDYYDRALALPFPPGLKEMKGKGEI